MIIHTENLKKIYKMGVERIAALDGLSMDIEPNEYVAIMGSSGSGKSTLMNIIGCLDRPTSGKYKLNGTDVSRMNSRDIARARNEQIGFVFQSFELLSRMTAERNVEMPLLYSQGNWSSRRRLARQAMERVGLGDRRRHKPSQLSGGQKQRVALARAILNKPAILLADEPTGNLDSGTTKEILELFDQLHDDGQTIIIVTHENDVAAHCQRIIRLVDGKISSDLQSHDDHAGAAHPHIVNRRNGNGSTASNGDADRENGETDPC